MQALQMCLLTYPSWSHGAALNKSFSQVLLAHLRESPGTHSHPAFPHTADVHHVTMHGTWGPATLSGDRIPGRKQLCWPFPRKEPCACRCAPRMHRWPCHGTPIAFQQGGCFCDWGVHSGAQDSPHRQSGPTTGCAAEMRFPALPWSLKKTNTSVSDRMPWQMLLPPGSEARAARLCWPHRREEGGQWGHSQAGCRAGSWSSTVNRDEVLHKSSVLEPFPRALWVHSSLPPVDISCCKRSLSLYICSHSSGNQLIQSHSESCCLMVQQPLSAAQHLHAAAACKVKSNAALTSHRWTIL